VVVAVATVSIHGVDSLLSFFSMLLTATGLDAIQAQARTVMAIVNNNVN